MNVKCIASVALMMSLVACSTPRGLTDPPQNPLVIAECPELGPVSHKTFGDVITAYLALLEQYHRCQAAQGSQGSHTERPKR